MRVGAAAIAAARNILFPAADVNWFCNCLHRPARRLGGGTSNISEFSNDTRDLVDIVKDRTDLLRDPGINMANGEVDTITGITQRLEPKTIKSRPAATAKTSTSSQISVGTESKNPTRTDKFVLRLERPNRFPTSSEYPKHSES